MQHEPTSKNIDGITDLVVVAPIKEGFIHAYENITYGTRLKLVAEALNRVRITAREYERITPFSDVTERILTLLDFRVGIIDKDLFSLPTDAKPNAPQGPQAKRYLYLTATFDGAWEPYMRLIWNPLGPFLDLLFCNCEGYVTAGDHGFAEYAQWVRDNQMDSAIFYATTGLTVRDHLYLNRLEQLQRTLPAEQADQTIARLTMPNPERAAAAERRKALASLPQDPREYLDIHRLALEALTVLYRLADYYPPEWLTGQPVGLVDEDGNKVHLREGRYLARVARDLLLGWEELIPKPSHPAYPMWAQYVLDTYADPLHWFDSGKAWLDKLDTRRERRRTKDPVFVATEIQSGILTSQDTLAQSMRSGALLLMTVTDAAAARRFLANDLRIAYDGDASDSANPFFRTIGFTADGLRRMGLDTCILDLFPKEFRDGMELRSGLIGDMRENHPRNWILPRRNWPPVVTGAAVLPRPPVELSEVDIVIQIRSASSDPAMLEAEIKRLADSAAPGLQLVSYETMASNGSNRTLPDHFGFADGVSQPKPTPDLDDARRTRDQVRLGEALLGYRNDHGDDAPGRFACDSGPFAWRAKLRKKAQHHYQRNGSFLVIRKLEQDVDTFDRFIAAEVGRINIDHTLPKPMTADWLKALMLGRETNGQPLISPGSGGPNDFDYAGDPDGTVCPFAAHVRRANPRNVELGRRAPRILRRGMAYDRIDPVTAKRSRGVIFMAHNASIAEQYETIQRWINGGNSTHIASGHNDPLIGVAPNTGALYPAQRVFRFVEQGQVIRVAMPQPFVTLHWGLYLFMPSRTALHELTRLRGEYQPMDEMLELSGKAVVDRISRLDPDARGREWKRLLEDFDAKDPSERNISPDMWSAIRLYRGGAVRTDKGMPMVGAPRPDWEKEPDRKNQPIIIVASYKHVMRTLADWRHFTTEEQLRRIEGNSGPIYVTQQPDNSYRNTLLNGKKYDYQADATATNGILMEYSDEAGYDAGYKAARSVLDDAQRGIVPGSSFYELELRRQFVLPALRELCKIWYGLPDGKYMQDGAWLWEPPAARTPPGARCPGDFLSPSRNAFYPRPSETVGFFAEAHGKAILNASKKFVKAHRANGGAGTGTVAQAMFAAIPNNNVLARNLIGTMIGAIPPMDGNLRGILLEWLDARTLWRNQAALRSAFRDQRAEGNFAMARGVLYRPVSQAMCKRPAPDLLYRTVTLKGQEKTGFHAKPEPIEAKDHDLVVASLVSASQESLRVKKRRDRSFVVPDGDVSIIFGGNRRKAYETQTRGTKYPVHACPAQKMAMGAIMGIMAALLDAGRIQALPASLIVRISDW